MGGRALAVTAIVAGLLLGLPAQARVQGVKGRRLEVFGNLMTYRRGTVILEEPRLITNMTKAVVRAEGVRAYAHQFLDTRLRELGWTVLPWYDEFGPVARATADGPVLVADATVRFESGLANSQLVLEVFFRDQATGRVLARYQGYGKATMRSTWPGARDDLQEITRVLAGYLATELQVPPPAWNGYDSSPYRRRQRRDIAYQMLATDKNASLPHAQHHDDPPINEQAREDATPDEPHDEWHEDEGVKEGGKGP